MAISGNISSRIYNEILKSDNWAIRRRWMKLWTLGFAFNGEIILGWTLWFGGSAYGTEIFFALLTAITAVMFAYVFGAVWDDHSKRHLLGASSSNCEDGDDNKADDRDPPDTAGKEDDK